MENIIKILDMTGKESGVYTFDASILEAEKGQQAVKDTVVAFLSGLRAGTACTKGKGQVSGGGAKPFRQKGTGRARSGSSRSPIWTGGGTVFGPQANHNYNKKVNKKVRRLALRRAFTERLIAGDIIIVDEVTVETPKTKEVVSFLNAINAGNDVLVVVDDYEMNFYLGASNLPRVDVITADLINVYQLLLFKKIVITKAGLEMIEKRLKGEKIYE
ncbi:MAG: 50S ribosomal protein L4 [Lentisphaeria bacterium]